jgi:hypothetical protein
MTKLLLTAALLAAVTAVPALAGDGPVNFTKKHAGSARFQDQGDHVFLCDHLADGHSVAVHLRYRSESGRNVDTWRWNWWGAERFNGCKDINLAVKEDTELFYKPCLGDHGEPGGKRADVIESSCGGWFAVRN